MEQLLGGILGIVVLIFAICLAISWILFPMWIYSINEHVKVIQAIMEEQSKR